MTPTPLNPAAAGSRTSALDRLAAEARLLRRAVTEKQPLPLRSFAIVFRANVWQPPQLKRTGLTYDEARAFQSPVSVRDGTTHFVISGSVVHAILSGELTVDQVFAGRVRLGV